MNTISGEGKIIKSVTNGSVFEGRYQLHGVGKMTSKDGRITNCIWENGKLMYEGELNEKGEPHGTGKKIYSDNGINVSDIKIKNEMKNGTVSLEVNDVAVYEGEFKDGRRHGRGTYKWPDGSSYEGEWSCSKQHGKGICKYADGSIKYDGEYKHGKKNGVGTYNYDNGNVYEGEFRNNRSHGKGVMAYANQDKYEGEWKKGMKDGKGIMRYHNGNVFQGEFRKGKMHGKGVFEYAAGDIIKSVGEWKKGKRCGFFDETVRVVKRIYYEYGVDHNDDSDVAPHKRVKVCVSPS